MMAFSLALDDGDVDDDFDDGLIWLSAI